MTTSSRRRHVPGIVTVLLATLLALSTAPALARPDAAFPAVTPEEVGLSSEALDALADVVDDYVARDMVVGAELLVIKDRHTVLHEAFGWRDREAELPMERDTLFNIRSMTKPVTGAAVQILIDEGALSLDDRVSDHLLGFDTEGSREITVEQLLTHRSGLPLSVLTSTDDYASLQAMADEIGDGGPQFEPGSRFWYSDAGADTLGALVEAVSGMPLEAFVRSRLLEPLGMTDSWYVDDAEDPRTERLASLYVGRTGAWSAFWRPGIEPFEPFYPFAWGSQGLYSTPADYARFLAMWLDDGMAGDTRILSPEAVERSLTPTSPMGSLGSEAPYPTRFSDLLAYHGQMALLHLDAASLGDGLPTDVPPTIVGYSGSDGTIAWAWPERDLIILYFTQSRGGLTPLRLEAEIERLLLDGSRVAEATAPPELADVLGTYTANFDLHRNEPFEILWRDGSLALDVPSQFIYVLEPVDGEERWTLREEPGVSIWFERDEAGAVSALRIDEGGEIIDVPRGEPMDVAEVVLRLEDAEPYLGPYVEAGSGRRVEILFEDGRLALRIPEAAEPLALTPPDADDVARLQLDPRITFSFSRLDGEVVGYTVRAAGEEATFTRIEPSDPTAD